MARSRKISELEAMCRWQADQDRAELRHTSKDLRRVINQSIQRLRETISDNGHSYFLTSHSGSMTAGAAKDTNGQVFAWGLIDTASVTPELVRVYGIDVTINGINEELDAVEFRERNFYQFGGQNGIPIAFFGYNETKIGILPPPANEYAFTLWYLPVLAELTEDDDEFNPGLPGAEEWVVWDVMYKILNRDNYPQLINACASERERLLRDILHRASRHQRAGPVKRIDTRGRSRNKGWRNYRNWFALGGAD